MFDLKTLEDTPNAISSAGLRDGQEPLNLGEYRQLALFGRPRSPVSRGLVPEKAKEQTTNATCGPSSSNSSKSVALQSLLESKLRAKTEGVGSLEYDLTWKHWDMKSGPPICALRASGRKNLSKLLTNLQIKSSGKVSYRLVLPTSGKESFGELHGWPTPKVEDDNQDRMSLEAKFRELNRPSSGSNLAITAATSLAGWPTPCQQDGPHEGPAQGTDRLPACAMLAGWPTPRREMSHGHCKSRAENPELAAKECRLEDVVTLAGWTTPQAHDVTPRSQGQKAKHGTKHGCADLNADAQLAMMKTGGVLSVDAVTTSGDMPICRVAGWPTPNASNVNDGESLETWEARRQENLKKGYNGNGQGTPLAIAALMSGWPTPVVPNGGRSPKLSMSTMGKKVDGSKGQVDIAYVVRGLTLNSSPAETANTAGYRLNPAFSLCFLMGFPDAWLIAGHKALCRCTPSRRKKPSKAQE